jgi:hypothetical protein
MTSATRAAARRLARRAERAGKPSGAADRAVVKHGVCSGCGRRREIVKPALLCERCLKEKA